MTTRTFLTKPELATQLGKELFDLCRDITADGKLDLAEVRLLRKWLRANAAATEVAAVSYLHTIMERIVADGVVDKDEQLELLMALERVIPRPLRHQAESARKARQADVRKRKQAILQAEKEKQRCLREEDRELERQQALRIRHHFSKVAGVSFPNDDGTDRQSIIARCMVGEWLTLLHDPTNRFSKTAIKVIRQNGEQLGHVKSELSTDLLVRQYDGYRVRGIISSITGGTRERPTKGVNYAVVTFDESVGPDELQNYANSKVLGHDD